MKKIDIHTHILPQQLPRWKEKFGYGGFIQLDHHKNCCARMIKDDGTFFREVESNCWDPEVRIQECKRDHIDVQVLSTVPVMFNYWTQDQHGNDIARFLNDHIHQVVNKSPQHFVGLGTVPLQNIPLAIRELERCKKELGFAGVQIGTNVNGLNFSEPQFFDFFSAAQELDACLFIHPWDMLAPERLKNYWSPWLIGMPTELAIFVSSLIFSGVLEKLPNLRIALAHGGGSFPSLLGRWTQAFSARPDLMAKDNAHPPEKYLRRFFVDSLVHDENYFQFLLKTFGENQIVLGSDYPFPLGESPPGKLIHSMKDLPTAAKEKILWKNAWTWLGQNQEKQFLERLK